MTLARVNSACNRARDILENSDDLEIEGDSSFIFLKG